MKKYFLIIFTILMFGSTLEAAPSSEYKIAAVVNGDAISSYILEQRLNLAIRSSGLPNTPEVRNKVRQQVLQILIDEKLKEQEAARLKLEVAGNDMAEAIAGIEKQNNLKPGEFSDFLAKQGLPEESVKDQIHAQIAWKKVVIQKIRPKINITDDEVAEASEVLANQSGKKQLDLTEIVLKVDGKENEGAAKTLADKLVSQAKAGADFVGMAKQFSSAENASEGGGLGWLTLNQLDPKVAKILDKLKSGEISRPIRTEKGYEIFKVNKVRSFIIGDDSESEVNLKQILLPLAPDAPPGLVEAARRKLKEAVAEITDCKTFDNAAAGLKASRHDFGKLKIKNIAEEIRPVISNLKINEPSDVLRNASGLNVFMVCDRVDAEGSEIVPDNSRINEILVGQKIDLEARKYLKRLRDEAFIEKRI